MTRARIGRSESTPKEQQRAALVTCDRIGARHGREAAAAALAALDLIKPLAEQRGYMQPSASAGPQPAAARAARPATLTASSPECGTIKGAQAHHRAEEPLCELCEAWSDERHRRTKVAPGSKCGTPAGAQMHRQLGEKVCPRCTKRTEPKPAAVVAVLRGPAGKVMTLAELARFVSDATDAGATGTETVKVHTIRVTGGSGIRLAGIDIVPPAPTAHTAANNPDDAEKDTD